jgi:hypothetical protein
MPYCYDGEKQDDRATSLLLLEHKPDITYKATAATLPFCYLNPRLKALRIAGFLGAIMRQLGEVIEPPKSNDPTDGETATSRNMEHAGRILAKWVAMLDLTDVLSGPLPYQLKGDDPNPTAKEVKAPTFACTINMNNNISDWHEDKLFFLVRKQSPDAPVTPSSHGFLSANLHLFSASRGDIPSKTIHH